MARSGELLISMLSTALSAVSMLYLLAFIHDAHLLHGVATTVNHRPKWVPSFPVLGAISPPLANLALVLVFALQHSVSARPAVRGVVVKTLLSSNDYIYPSFYAISSSVSVILLCIFWSPIEGNIWSVQQWPWFYYTVQVVNWCSWGLTLVSILSIHRFQLCGAEPLVEFLFGRITALQGIVKEEKKLVTSGMYGLVRHPTMFFLILSFWIVPVMSIGQSVLALCMTAYIVFAVKVYEEPQLLKEYGKTYEQYKKKVPFQLIPGVM